MSSSASAAPALKAAPTSWGTASWATSITQSYPITAGSNQILLVWVWNTHDNASTVTYNGTAMTLIAATSNNGSRFSAYRMVNPPVGTANIVVSIPSGGYPKVTAAIYTGVNQTTPLGASIVSGSSGGATPPTHTISHTRNSATSTVVISSMTSHAGVFSSNTTSNGTNQYFLSEGSGEARSFNLADWSPGTTGATSITSTRNAAAWGSMAQIIFELNSASAVCGNPVFCNDTFTLNNSANLPAPGELQLTNGGTWQRGSAWDPNTLDLNSDFTFNVNMYFGTNASGADGMAFVLRDAGAAVIGNDGGNLGYGGLPTFDMAAGTSITPSIAVEFDTFQNSGSALPDTVDPAYDHIMLDENGNVIHGGCPASVTTATGTCPVQASASSANIKDGRYHNVQIVWTASSKVMQVFFDGSLRLTYTKDLAATIFSTNCVVVGFTGGTGGATNDQRVRLCPVLTDTADCATGMTVDGTMNEASWSNETWQAINRVILGTTSVTGQYKALWDPTYLYVGVQMFDTSLHDNGGGAGNTYNSSSVELNLDMSNSPTGFALNSTEFHYSVRYNNAGFVSTGGNTSSTGVNTATTSSGAGYIVEWQIPWSTLGVSPAVGSTYGFDIGVNVADATARVAGLAWQGDGSDYLQTLNFGKLQLIACSTSTSTATPTITRTITRTSTPTVTPTRTPSTTPTITLTATRSNTASVTPTITTTSTPGGVCSVSYNGDAGSWGGFQVGSSTWTQAWTPGASTDTVMFLVIDGAANYTEGSLVKYAGVSMTLLIDAGETLIYYLVNPTAGSNNITIDSVPDDWTAIAVTAFSYGGVYTSNPFLGNNYATGTALSVNLTPGRSDSLVLAMLSRRVTNNSTTHTITGGTSRHSNVKNINNDRTFGFGDIASTGAAMTITQAFNNTGGTIQASAIELNPCGPQPSPTTTSTFTTTGTITRTATPTRTATRTFTDGPTPTNTATRTQTPNWTATITSTPMPSTPTMTYTPIAIPMNKSASVGSAALGDTVTYCIAWTNNSGGATNVVIWDTVPGAMTFTGYSIDGVTSAAGGSYSPRLAVFNLGSKANLATGTVCFWGVISGYPWLPGIDYGQWLAHYIREEDMVLPLCVTGWEVPL